SSLLLAVPPAAMLQTCVNWGSCRGRRRGGPESDPSPPGRLAMRPFWKEGAAVGFLAFLALWGGGTISGARLPATRPGVWYPPVSEVNVSRADNPRQQLANNLKQLGRLARAPLPVMLDLPEADRIQVYEKTAQLALGSTAFDEDEELIRAALTAHQGTVF